MIPKMVEVSELFPQYSDDQKMAAEKQINDLQRIVDYMIREYSIEELVEQYQTGRDQQKNKLFIPKARRKWVWNEKQQSLFIESVLLGLPMAHFFVVENPKEHHRLEMIDGAQRLRTLESFIDNKLVLNDLHKLTLLNGFRFKDLPLSRQRRFKARVVWLIELTDKADRAVRDDIFIRVNQTISVPVLAAAGVENHFDSFLEHCAQNSKLIQLCPVHSAESPQIYRTMVLHFWGWIENQDPYPFLEYAKQPNKGFDKTQMEEDFENMLDFVDAHFPYGFRKSERHQITPMLRFEVLAVGVYLALKEKANLIPAKPIKSWIESLNFLECMSHIMANPNHSTIMEGILFVKTKLLVEK
jgi:hypothetical protein